MTLPPVFQDTYNRSLRGVFGEFGAGAGSRAFYLQAAVLPKELEHIDLVSQIPGAEKWPVRSLFQREVDTDRVTRGLIPYLQDSNRVRFFNPLTLTLLPMDDHGHTVLPAMPAIHDAVETIDGVEWNVLERPDFYRFRWTKDSSHYGVVEWNDSRSRLVAIDGQHRLFGLKRLWRDPMLSDDFLAWRIPVVVVSFRAREFGGQAATVLDTVRSIFVAINTNARQVNEAREVLLSDASINALCTQELLESAHANDQRPLSDRDHEKLPLLFFDWRGEERGGKLVKSRVALKTTVEIRDWFCNYFLGPDFDKHSVQQKAMEITPGHPLHAAFLDGRLTHQQAECVRLWFRDHLLEPLEYLLTTFAPYGRYVAELRRIERETRFPRQIDVVRHAFEDLRFGSNQADETLQADVRELRTSIENAIERAKATHLGRLIQEDIGFRGIAWAFGRFRERFSGPPNWLQYSRRFTAALNRAYDDGWLTLSQKTPNGRLLRHVAEDHAETIVNYRLQSAQNALGTHVALLVGAYGTPWPKEWRFSWAAFLEDRLETWRWTVERGYRKEFKSALLEQYPEQGTPLTQAVNRKASTKARQQAGRFRAALERIAESKPAAEPVSGRDGDQS